MQSCRLHWTWVWSCERLELTITWVREMDAIFSVRRQARRLTGIFVIVSRAVDLADARGYAESDTSGKKCLK